MLQNTKRTLLCLNISYNDSTLLVTSSNFLFVCCKGRGTICNAYSSIMVKIKVKVKLRFSAPSAGIVEVAVIKSATPIHDAQVVKPYRVSNPLCLIVLTAN